MGLLLLSIVRDGVELGEQALRRPPDLEALLRRIEGRIQALRGRDECSHTFVQRIGVGEWVPLDKEAWPLPAVARLRVHLVPRFAPPR